MAVILLPLHMPATHWVPQRMTWAPIPGVVTPSSGTEPRPEIDYWEFTQAVDRALRVQFRVPDGYAPAVNPIFSFHWFTASDGDETALCKIGQMGCQESDAVRLDGRGVGTLTTVSGMTDAGSGAANIVIDEAQTLNGSVWAAGDFATIVFLHEGTGDSFPSPLKFLGGDLLIGVTKEMG